MGATWKKKRLTLEQAIARAQADADRMNIVQVVYLYQGSYFVMAEVSARWNRITPIRTVRPSVATSRQKVKDD
jgi:hypothetical protein